MSHDYMQRHLDEREPRFGCVHLPHVQVLVFFHALVNVVRLEALRDASLSNVAHLHTPHARLRNHVTDDSEHLVCDVLDPVDTNNYRRYVCVN